MDEDFANQIKRMTESYTNLGNRIYEELRPAIIAIEELQRRMSPIIQQLSATYNSCIKTGLLALERFDELAKVWQEQQKQNLADLAECGWFPNWYTFDYQPEGEAKNIDTIMSMHLNDCWPDLTNKIVELCPNRKHVLETAFRLHEEENYIASVPLFIMQSDGIFCEELKTFLFEGKDKPLFKGEETEQFLGELLENGNLQKGFLQEILLEPYKVKTQFSKGIRKSKAEDKKKAPNRHGILHGHRKHLDYGTELNSLKSISLLAFVVYSTKEILKK